MTPFDDNIADLNSGLDDEIDNFISDEVLSSFYWRSTVARWDTKGMKASIKWVLCVRREFLFDTALLTCRMLVPM